MADDHSQRPYRASQPPTRSAPSAAPAAPSGNDPLAELARLIGQTDPFAEYGRDGRHAAPPAAAPEQHPDAYADERYVAAPAPAQHADYGASDAYPQHPDAYPQQAYGTAPRAAYQGRAPLAGYAPEAEYPTNGHSGAEEQDFYDDVPPRRRMGILAIAAVFALAVIGTAGAFGYRALFGSSGASGPPPVIKADATPTKIVPAASSKDPKSGKLIYDRVADRAQGEKLVSREEQPIEMKDKPAGRDGAARSERHSARARERRDRDRTEEGPYHRDPARRHRHGRTRADVGRSPPPAPRANPGPFCAAGSRTGRGGGAARRRRACRPCRACRAAAAPRGGIE